ncbi:MAG: thioredoxin domain-containing protein [Novosphingobium sp.]|nr:thioredoxin domain-containing protein [Novosphingobium sp.]
MTVSTARPRVPTLVLAAALLLLGLLVGWLWEAHRVAADPAARLAASDRAAYEKVVHDYILAHPEILPEAMEALHRREDAKSVEGVRDALFTPFPGSVLGNPNGKVTLVEFTDFACTFCKRSVEDVEALIAANPDLKVVVRQLPILSPQSTEAAKIGLAVAEQGHYPAFHHAMFEIGKPDPQAIAAAAAAAGADLDQAKQQASDRKIAAELDRNLEFARQLGFTGTPSWVVGNRLLSGAIGQQKLAEAIAAARG